MPKFQCVAGATSQSVNVFVRKSTDTAGLGLAAIAPAGGALLTGTKLDYSFTGAAATRANVALAVLATVTTAWTTAGIVSIDDTNMIGWVRIDIPNAALAAASGRMVSFLLWGGTNMAPTPFDIELTAVNNQSATAFMTSVATVTTVTNQLTAAQIATGVWQDATAGDFTTASSIGKSLYTSGVVPGGTNGLFIAGTNAATTVTTALTTTFTGNLTGSVASVTAGVTVANGGIAAASFGAGAVDSVALAASASNAIADATLDRAAGVETGLTFRQAMRLIAAACSGLASGLAGTPAIYKSADIAGGVVQGTKSRITATVDADGNRSAITVDLT